MIGILKARFRLFLRNPWMFILFTVMALVFTIMLGSTGGVSTITIPVFSDEAVEESMIGESLKEADSINFRWVEAEEDVYAQISSGKAEAGVILSEDTYQVIVGIDSVNTEMINRTLHEVYHKKIQVDQIIASAENQDEVELRQQVESAIASEVFAIESHTFRSTDAVVFDGRFQYLFGFTLFFVIFTIAYNVLPILTEKKEGLWDRIILSPVKKWEMYVANLIYSFFEGYLQVLIIFLVYRFAFNVDFDGRFLETLLLLVPYVFAIVALSILVTAIVKNEQQFNAFLPILATSMAMIGGAYWPIEIVESEILLALAKINPLTYGMEVLNGTAIYGHSLGDLMLPISLLILMGVVFMGIGIHLMERRHV